MDFVNTLKMRPYMNLLSKIDKDIYHNSGIGATFVDFAIERHLNNQTALDEIKKKHPYLVIKEMGENQRCERTFRGSWKDALNSQTLESSSNNTVKKVDSPVTDSNIQTMTQHPTLLMPPRQVSFEPQLPVPPRTQRPILQTPQFQGAGDSQNILTFGKYNGKSYESIKQSDVTYCNWVLKQVNVAGKMLHFQLWLKSNSKKVTCECCNGSGLVDAM